VIACAGLQTEPLEFVNMQNLFVVSVSLLVNTCYPLIAIGMATRRSARSGSIPLASTHTLVVTTP